MATGVSTSTSDVITGLHHPGDVTIPRDPVEHGYVGRRNLQTSCRLTLPGLTMMLVLLLIMIGLYLINVLIVSILVSFASVYG